MSTTRLEAFSDGVMAIIITIMVLELKVPHGTDLNVLMRLLPVFLSYLLSFVYVGIYWNNHHHLFQTTHEVSGGILWANLHLLFWLSLLPFATGWMGENHFATLPVAIYGVVLAMSSLAFWILQRTIIAKQGVDSALKKAIGKDFKGKASSLAYLVAIPLSFIQPVVAGTIYVAVAAWWLIPDRRIETQLEVEEHPPVG